MGKNIFNSIRVQKPKTNTFDLTHDVKLSTRMGHLTPVLCTEVVPGDKFNIGADTLVRFAPMIAPVMHRFDVSIHYFFCPNRIVWSNWEQFIVGQTAVAPYFNATSSLTADQKKFCDYMGVPPVTTGTLKVSLLPFACYQKIYNEYYRDQNLVDPIDTDLADGQTSGGALAPFLTMRKRAWQHDYFTSSLPFAQKGADVEIPLGDVYLDPDYVGSLDFPEFRKNNGSPANSGPPKFENPNPALLDAGNSELFFDPNGSLKTGSTTINSLRRAFKLQEWLEKNARGGTRYIENILSHFGVRSSDKRLQRPEYITGVKTPVVVSEVLNTSGQVLPDGSDGDPLPQGNMAGHAVSVGQGHNGSYYAEEHGYIIGIMSVMPKPAYMQGLPRTFSKFSSLDYFWPSFAHIGEQEVKNQEIYVDSTTKDGTFGYVPRYAEYKYMPSRVAGEFRSTLDYWHLGRKFASQPNLSQEFIECDPTDLTRIFAVQDGTDELYCHVLHRITARRPMPVYGTPML